MGDKFQPEMTAGHSLGEYAALVVSGVLSFDEAVPFIKKRGEVFYEAFQKHPSAMGAIIGIPEEQLRLAAQKAVCKINIDSDLRLAMTACIRQYFNEHPEHFDPRQYLGPARDAIRAMVKHKIVDVLGCDGKA